MTLHGLLELKRRQPPILSSAGIIFTLKAFCALARVTSAQTIDTFVAREIAKLDGDFSALSADRGMPAACLAYFANDGIAFAPLPVNGTKYWASRTEFAGTLVWQPIFAAVAAAGDLGYTTGPWELKNKRQGASLGFGNYVTVWRKQSGGAWKIALDVGTENPQPSQAPPPLQVLPADATAGQHPVVEARHNLDKTLHVFTEEARRGIGGAIVACAADEIRVLRDKSFPAVGLAAAQVILSSEHGKVGRRLEVTKLSSSGDLCYTYGKYSEERGNLSERGIYVMIWRLDLNSDWKIVFDLQKKLRPDNS